MRLLDQNSKPAGQGVSTFRELAERGAVAVGNPLAKQVVRGLLVR